MANLTLSVDDQVLRRARIRALEQGTSVNALVRTYLAEFAGENPAAEAVQELLEMTEDLDAGSGAEGRAWTREELYRERTRWPRRPS